MHILDALRSKATLLVYDCERTCQALVCLLRPPQVKRGQRLRGQKKRRSDKLSKVYSLSDTPVWHQRESCIDSPCI